MVKALGLTWRETVSHLTLGEAGESLLLSQGLFEKGQARFHGETSFMKEDVSAYRITFVGDMSSQGSCFV